MYYFWILTLLVSVPEFINSMLLYIFYFILQSETKNPTTFCGIFFYLHWHGYCVLKPFISLKMSNLTSVSDHIVSLRCKSVFFFNPHLHVGLANWASSMFLSTRLPPYSVLPLFCARRCRPSRTWQRSWRRLVPWSPSLVTCCAPSLPCLTSEPHPLHFLRRFCARARSATHAGNYGNWFGKYILI